MRQYGALVAVAIGLVSTVAHADPDDATKSSYRAVVDRVELEPSSISGTSRLRVYLSALSIDGHLLDLGDPKSIRLMIGASEKKAPYALGEYHEVRDETAIVFVIENAQQYADVLPVIIESLDTKLLAGVRDQGTQIAVLAYGDGVGSGKLGSIKIGKTKLAQIATDGSVGDPAMLDTVERALTLLKRAKSEAESAPDAPPGVKGRPLRKMIILVGDGRDRGGDRDRITRIGQRAAKEGVRIHSLAFAPNDVRRPLLALGELSKQSLGTFRWVRSGKIDSWGPMVQLLSDEIEKQNVLTFFLAADDDVANKKLKIITVGRTEATSNELKIPELNCAGQTCDGYCTSDGCVVPQGPKGRGIVGWVILVGGIGLGAIVLLGVVGAVITRKKDGGVKLPAGFVMGTHGLPVPIGSPLAAPVTVPVTGPPAPGSMPPGSIPPGSQPPMDAKAAKKLAKSKPPKDMAAGIAAAQAAQAQAANAPGPALFVLSGARAGERIPLRHGFAIGKAPGSDLMIDDGFASSQHAQIGMDHFGNCRLYDRGSTNGTLCNGVRVTEYALANGCVIQIGNTQLRFLAQ